jgi:hypothetical protein
MFGFSHRTCEISPKSEFEALVMQHNMPLQII